MARGKEMAVGSERVAPNGYTWVKCLMPDGTTKWRGKHHLVMEEHLGRPLRENERVSFVKGKTNFAIDNLVLSVKGTKSNARRIAQLEARRMEIDAELAELRGE